MLLPNTLVIEDFVHICLRTGFFVCRATVRVVGNPV